MYIVGRFIKTKKLFGGSIPDIKDFKKMCRDGTDYVLVMSRSGEYEYLKCELIPTGNDLDVVQHTKYVCGKKGISEWYFMDEGISCETLKKSPEFIDVLSEIMEPVGMGHAVGITVHDRHVALVDYVLPDLLHFHNEEKRGE